MRIFTRAETPTPDQDEARREQIRDDQVAAARSRRGWRELRETDLVARGPARYRWVVHVPSDELFRISGGSWFAESVISADPEGVSWYVDRDGWPVVLERVDVARTWSDVIRKRPDLATVAST